jgi:ribonuclease Z
MWRRCSKNAVCCSISEKIALLSARRIRRIDQIFISHAHIDHFVGFDHLLRLLVGHEKSVQLFGASGFAERVFHKLQPYRWNLVESYPTDLVFVVSELGAKNTISTTRFRLRKAFATESSVSRKTFAGVLCDEPTHRVSAAILEHGTPCLAFALQEAAHVNVWKNPLLERGLPVGPWLRSLKKAVVERRADDHFIHIDGSATTNRGFERLGSLRDILMVTADQKIAYVTDVADTPANRAAIVALVQNPDILFIEAAFAAADKALARDRAHLTTTAAGEIARAANVHRVEPFHFSPRYAGDADAGRGDGGVQRVSRITRKPERYFMTGERHLPAGLRKSVRLFLCGDVMCGRGIDQVLAHPCSAKIYED